MMKAKNKKEMDRAQKMIDSIKKGHQVMTASGVIGKVVAIEEKNGFKTVTIETGNEKHKGYMTLDINAIYANLSNPSTQSTVNPVQENKEQAEKQPKQEEQNIVEENVVEQSKEQQPKVEEAKKDTKKSSKKKSK